VLLSWKEPVFHLELCLCSPNNIPTSLDISEAYLAEIEGENLQLFGPGALESLDKNWGDLICGLNQTK